MMPDLPDFEKILRLLATHSVRFVLIGGVAMRLHGSSHLTEDIDFLYARTPENLEALALALRDHHPRLRGAPEDLPFRWDSRTLKAGLNFTLNTDLGPIDTLGQAAGVASFEEVERRAVLYSLDDLIVPVACLDDLIAMKRAAGRPKDHNHILELLALKELTTE